ncbi:MAG: hypothetical protein U5R30_12735, partial [Deltaproteobacteria bacterium]|nr:hypothetical protein [Deltaproteobacteria bacterium]
MSAGTLPWGCMCRGTYDKVLEYPGLFAAARVGQDPSRAGAGVCQGLGGIVRPGSRATPGFGGFWCCGIPRPTIAGLVNIVTRGRQSGQHICGRWRISLGRPITPRSAAGGQQRLPAAGPVSPKEEYEIHLVRESFITDRIGTSESEISQSFFQTNTPGAERLHRDRERLRRAKGRRTGS